MSQDLHESNAEIETIAPPEPPKPAKEWVFTFESLAQKSLSYFFMNEGDNQAEEIENNIGFEDSIELPTTFPSPPSAPVEISNPVNVKPKVSYPVPKPRISKSKKPKAENTDIVSVSDSNPKNTQQKKLNISKGTKSGRRIIIDAQSVDKRK